MFAPSSKRLKLEKSQKARAHRPIKKDEVGQSISDKVRSDLEHVGEPIANLMRTK